MTSVTFCAYCGAGMLHVEAETCSSYCRAQLAVRRASMVSTTELLERAERAVPPADARDVPTYELDRPEQYDRAPAVIVWTMGGIFVALGFLLVWAFA